MSNYWIENKAGVCPVNSGVLVDVVFDDGDIKLGCPAEIWNWGKEINIGDRGITHYRICETQSYTHDQLLTEQRKYNDLINKIADAAHRAMQDGNFALARTLVELVDE